MDTRRCLICVLFFAVVLAPLAFAPQIVAAQGGIGVSSVETSAYGTFNGIAYVKHEGRFVGTAAGDYSVPFEIITPTDPAQGNGVVVMEPFHVVGGAIGRDAYLTPQLLFERGFSYAGVGWHPDAIDPFGGYSVEDALEILHNFGKTLRESPASTGAAGSFQKLYGVGVSLTCTPLFTLLDSPGGGLLDFTFLMGPGWPHVGYEQPPQSKYVIVFLSEADFVLAEMQSEHQDTLRGSSATYRSYDVAGGPHVPETPAIQAMGPQMGIELEGGLDWGPVARALFMAGHRWAAEGKEPPPSAYLTEGSHDANDPVYAKYGLELKTAIARDENGNALGGIRLPDLEVGRFQYIAMQPASWGGGLMGAAVDLACEPLADGSPRFPDHGSYVSQFTQQAQKLVADGHLLQEDADRLIADATQSSVGDPSACAPTILPETGTRGSGRYTQLLVLAGLILAGAGTGLCQWTRARRRTYR